MFAWIEQATCYENVLYMKVKSSGEIFKVNCPSRNY